jgi:uncharacterized integral membrane protein
MAEVDMTQYWNYVFIPAIILLILYFIYAVINSGDTQTMSSRGINSSIYAITKNIPRV